MRYEFKAWGARDLEGEPRADIILFRTRPKRERSYIKNGGEEWGTNNNTFYGYELMAVNGLVRTKSFVKGALYRVKVTIEVLKRVE